MNAWQWIKSMLSLSRTDEAAQREEYGLQDPGLQMLETDRIVHPASPPAHTAEVVLSQFGRPRDGTP